MTSVFLFFSYHVRVLCEHVDGDWGLLCAQGWEGGGGGEAVGGGGGGGAGGGGGGVGGGEGGGGGGMTASRFRVLDIDLHG